MHQGSGELHETLQDDRRFNWPIQGRRSGDESGRRGERGTRCGVFLLMAVKTTRSFCKSRRRVAPVLEPYVDRKSEYQNQGHRVVAGQRLLQATAISSSAVGAVPKVVAVIPFS